MAGCPEPLRIPHALASFDGGLVLNKPPGLLAVPGKGPDKQDCLSARVQAVMPQAQVVHRLDQATSGLMLMALSPEATRWLGQAFATGRVHKTYWAWVQGQLPLGDDWQDLHAPIALHWPDRPRRHVPAPGATGQASHTRWRARAHHPQQDATWVELQPLTGRTHQLRVHMAHLGHPILGDALYGQAAPHGLLLHAQALRLAHPVTADTWAWSCPPPWTSGWEIID